ILQRRLEAGRQLPHRARVDTGNRIREALGDQPDTEDETNVVFWRGRYVGSAKTGRGPLEDRLQSRRPKIPHCAQNDRRRDPKLGKRNAEYQTTKLVHPVYQPSAFAGPMFLTE